VAVIVETTPNPRAMKFTVGKSVGGPATFVDAASADDSVSTILDIDGVQSVFMTGNFVTVTRSDDSSWDSIVDAVVKILESSFG
jgi:hypothetical protein